MIAYIKEGDSIHIEDFYTGVDHETDCNLIIQKDASAAYPSLKDVNGIPCEDCFLIPIKQLD